ncbi:MAG: hypothetical protein WDO68_31355 [Gammaproteobacteria bacterium]
MHAVAADAPPRLTLTTAAKVYDDQRRVPISAELHDEKFEPLNDAAVALTVTSDDGVTQQVQMAPSGQGDGRYTALVDAASTGLYRVAMTAKKGNTDVGNLETHFRRNDGVVEHFGTQQNRPLLSALRIRQADVLAAGSTRRAAGSHEVLQSRYRRAADPRAVESARLFLPCCC